MIRARAGIGYALAEALDDGHCGLPEADLIAAASRLLDVPLDLIGEALALELADQQVVREIVGATPRAPAPPAADAPRAAGQPVIFLASLAAAERQIAEQLHRLLHGKPTWPAIDADRAIPWVEAKLGMTLAPGQQQALRLAVSSKVTAITGGPGVGKTTLMNAILRVLTAKHVKALLCAPTGRAAKRLAEATGLEAKTIHRLLEVNPRDGRFRRNEQTPARMRSARRRRDVDGRRAADGLAAARAADARRRAVRRRRRSAAVGRPRPGARGSADVRRRAGRAPHRRVPPGRGEPHHHERASHQSRARCRR